MQIVSDQTQASEVRPVKSRSRQKTAAGNAQIIKALSPPRRSYAQVAATPPSPQAVSHDPESGAFASGAGDVAKSSPTGSVIEISDSTTVGTDDEAPIKKAVKIVIPARGARVPSNVEVVSTRASHGIVKKRVLDNAATVSDQEADSPPKKKVSRVRRVTQADVPTKPSNTSSSKTTSRKTVASKKPRTEGGILDALDEISSDDVPPASILPEPQNVKPKTFKPLFNDSDDNGSPSPEKSRDDAEYGLISMSSLKLDSGKKPRYNEANVVPASGLLPAISIHAEDVTGMSPAPDFETWLELQGERYKELVESRRKKKTTSGEGQPSQDDTPSKQKIQGIPSLSFGCGRSNGKARAISPADNTAQIFNNEEASDHGEVPDIRKMIAMRPKDPNLFSTPTRNVGPSAASAETYAHSLSAPKLNSFEFALAKKGISLQAAVEKSSSSSATNEVYFADMNGHRVRALPLVCEVNSPEIHDVLLEEDYNDLPNLIAGSFRSWSHAAGKGYVLFSGWALQLPELDIEHAYAALRFTQYRHFINLSRVSPLQLHTVYTAHDNSKSILHAERRIAICLSPLLVIESHLLDPTDRGLHNKFIKGTLHQQEMQRFVGATCMVFGHGPVLHAQIDRDSMVFSTLGSSWRSDTKSDSSGAGYIRNPGLLSRSPEKSRTRSTKPILDVTDSVPIYDASDRDFDYAQDLENIDSVLPQLDHEVSAGSFAVVAYTMSTFKKGGNWHLNTNIQFVIVVKEFNEVQ